jgi:serine/threonine-protein kinase
MSNDLLPGMVVSDRYRIRTVIGAGSFGLVYAAVDVEQQRDVALKTLLPQVRLDAELLRRFEREAEICGMLKHPNTAAVLGGGHWFTPGRQMLPYLVFELVRGVPLSRILAVRQRLSLDEAASVVRQVLESLTEAHGLSIIHRDLKPDNILVVAPEHALRPQEDTGTLGMRLGVPEETDPVWSDLSTLPVKVLDFGLGKFVASRAGQVEALTRAGFALGSAPYMSPEQARGELELDHRADIYSVSMLLHRLLVGNDAYQGDNPVDIVAMQAREPLPALPEPWASHPIAAVYRKAGSKKTLGRYDSAAEMERALLAALSPGATATPPQATGGGAAGLFARIFGRRR